MFYHFDIKFRIVSCHILDITVAYFVWEGLGESMTAILISTPGMQEFTRRKDSKEQNATKIIMTITFNFVHYLPAVQGWTFAGETIGLNYALGCYMEPSLFAARRGTIIIS